MRKALALVFITTVAISSSCSRSYYHDAEVLSAYQRQAKALCHAADAKAKLSTCRRAKACAGAAQAGLEAVQVYQLASAAMTATIDDRVAADAAYAGAVAACGVAGISRAGADRDAGPTGSPTAGPDAGTLRGTPTQPTDGGTHD
jgi:hypothetical protein